MILYLAPLHQPQEDEGDQLEHHQQMVQTADRAAVVLLAGGQIVVTEAQGIAPLHRPRKVQMARQEKLAHLIEVVAVAVQAKQAEQQELVLAEMAQPPPSAVHL